MKHSDRNYTNHTNILETKNQYRDWLLSRNDVHTVAIGRKIVNGVISDNLSITIFTAKKKRKQEIHPDQQIPPFLNQHPTDVVEVAPFVPYVEEGNAWQNRKKWRPVPGGAEIYMPNSPFTGGLCTLGMFCHSTRPQDDPRAIYLLANAHCFPRSDQVIFQPESHEPDDRIAYASRIVNSSLVDGGIALMEENVRAEVNEIIGIGSPQGIYEISDADIGKRVIKSGRTTGVTIGTLAYLHADADDKREQIIISDLQVPFSDHGDSGSIILLEEGEHRHDVIALLWGGALNFTVCSPILPVCEELSVSLITAQTP